MGPSLWLSVSVERDSVVGLRAAVERLSDAFRESRSSKDADTVLVIRVRLVETNRAEPTDDHGLTVPTSRAVEHTKWPTTQKASETQSP